MTLGRTASFWLATWGGAGLVPRAPGTVGTLAALPAHFLLTLMPAGWHLLVVVLVLALGTLAAGTVAAGLAEEDPQIIVVDESASVLVGLWIAMPAGWAGVIAVVVLFRLLDIYKPWPIRAAERLRPAAIGIMADDVAAALLAGSLVRLAWHFL
jgi:phosphatidylglycerophosphatase A